MTRSSTPSPAALDQAARAHYRAHDFFAAHEAWEDAWRAARDPQAREAYQGLTQVAVACLHAQRGNPRGAVKVARRALRHLARVPWVWQGLDMAALRADLALWLADLTQGHTGLRCPRLRAPAPPAATPRPRRVRSFVLREGRLTPAQRRALATWGPHYLLPADRPLDPLAAFGRAAPLVLDIGFGDGQALLQQVLAHPDIHFLGTEVYRPGVGALLQGLARHRVTNVRVFQADAWQVLTHALPDAALDGVQVFFPDPWPKRRHRKRRLLQPAFADLLARKLKPGGWLHVVTDWPDYAAHIAAVLDTHPAFRNANPRGGPYPPARQRRPTTKFERKAQAQGRPAVDFLYHRRADAFSAARPPAHSETGPAPRRDPCA